MNAFEIKKKIHSCKITKDLIKSIENYIKFDIKKLFKLNSKNIKYYIEITDLDGEETFPSINNFKFNNFSDSTKSIMINFRYYSDQFDIYSNIYFDIKNFEYSEIKIKISSNNARDKSLSMYNGILRFIKSEYINNWFFDMHPFLYSTFWGIIIGSFFLDIIIYKIKDIYFVISYILMQIFMVSYLTFTKTFFPYFELDTKKNKRLKEFRKWLFLGFLSFIIFGILFTFLRKKIFGF